jgi:cyclophilin family peptidyl-prolyl cis-trans isomerase
MSNMVISTSMGDIVIRLREDVAPKHAAFMRDLIAKKVSTPQSCNFY